MKRLILILLLIISLVLILPGLARASFIPEVDGADHYTMLLYGGSQGQQLWYYYDKEFEGGDAGILEDIPDITPQRLYGWYRIIGDINDNDPEQAQDFIIGTIYAMDTSPGQWGPYVAGEQVRFTTDIDVDRFYFGIGTTCDISETIIADGALWTDASDNYRVTGNIDFNLRTNSHLELEAWAMLDNGDEWGFWRVTARHPVDNSMDVVFIYEDSTRSDYFLMGGFGFTL